MHFTFLKIFLHVVPVRGVVGFVKALKSSVQEIHHLAVARVNENITRFSVSSNSAPSQKHTHPFFQSLLNQAPCSLAFRQLKLNLCVSRTAQTALSAVTSV